MVPALHKHTRFLSASIPHNSSEKTNFETKGLKLLSKKVQYLCFGYLIRFRFEWYARAVAGRLVRKKQNWKWGRTVRALCCSRSFTQYLYINTHTAFDLIWFDIICQLLIWSIMLRHCLRTLSLFNNIFSDHWILYGIIYAVFCIITNRTKGNISTHVAITRLLVFYE